MRETTEQTTTPPRSYLAGVLASGLAAGVGALLTSFAGIEGTVLGALIGSMIVSVGTQVMKVPLAGMERRLMLAGFPAWRLRRFGLLRGVLTTPGAAAKLLRIYVSGPAIASIVTISTVGFALGMVGLSLFEARLGRPVSAATSGEPRAGTTVENLVRAAPAATSASTPTPQDTPMPTRPGQETPAQATSLPGAATPGSATATRGALQPTATASSGTVRAAATPTSAPVRPAATAQPPARATAVPTTAAPTPSSTPAPTATRRP